MTAFQSLIDATVTVADVGTRLFRRLPARRHELTVFDPNRRARLASLVAPGPKRAIEEMTALPALPFLLTVVSNRSPDTGEVVGWRREPGSRDIVPAATGLAWPERTFSL